MKKSVFFLAVCCLLLTSCKSTKIKPPRERDEFYLADLEDFELDKVSCLSAFGKSDAKATELYFYASPRTNNIYFYFKLGIDQVRVSFTYAERCAIYESFNRYLEIIQNSKLDNRNPTKKNSFNIGKTDLGWGMGGISRIVNTEYSTNYQFLEKNKPYFKVQFYSAQVETEKNIGSPYFAIYMSPAQIRKVMEICDQDKIISEIDRVLNEAYIFDNTDIVYSDSEVETPDYSFNDDE